MGLLNPGGPIAQFKRNRYSISPVELILQSGVRNGGRVSVHVGEGPERARMDAAWDDDKMIQLIIRELNFGRYAAPSRGKAA